MNELRILSVNIDGVYDKLEKIECIKYLSLYDLITAGDDYELAFSVSEKNLEFINMYMFKRNLKL